MEIDNIRKFLAANFNDEQLAALLAHTESGRLSFYSCCCLVGVPTAKHALRGAGEYVSGDDGHVLHSRHLPHAKLAELEFGALGWTEDGGSDSLRRDRLLPLIRAEMGRREIELQLRAISVTGELAEVPATGSSH